MNHTLLGLICSAIVSTSAFAKAKCDNPSSEKANKQAACANYDQGLSDQISCGYNAPAAIAAGNRCTGWETFVGGSFIYWNVGQQYMEVGRSALYGLTGATPSATGNVAMPDTKYKPGFKAMLGFEKGTDGWGIMGEYTWLHETTSNTFGSVPGAMVVGQEVFVVSDWFNNYSNASQQQVAQITTSWKMHMDLADLTVSRPFFQGRCVKVLPYGGVRGLWIRQAYTIDAVNTKSLTYPVASSINRSQCWSVGPVGGLEGQWLMGGGFRFQGDTGFSLLYTRYTTISHEENDQTALTGNAGIPGNMNGYGCLRPTFNSGLGFGWGTYSSPDHSCHFDFSATYDFMILWDQNVMRQNVGALANNNVGYADPAGDLYLHGLTINLRLDF